MDPELTGTFSAIGNDGEECTVEEWQTFRQKAGQWIADGFPELRTIDGDPVDCEDPEGMIFRIRPTGVILRRLDLHD